VSGLATVVSAWPALVAAIAAALIPKEAPVVRRIGLGAVAFASVLAVIWLWPSAAPSAAAAPAPAAPGAEWPHLLDVLIGLPIGAGFLTLFLPRQMLSLMRGFAYAIMGVTFVASLWLVSDRMTAGWHYEHIVPWIDAFGIRWHVAVDGMSVWLVILTTFTTPIAAYCSFGSIKSRQKELAAAFLILEGAMIGAFVALDLFVFYLFWELMLVPMFLMIGIWGGVEKIKASIKFFLFTMTGSMLMLAAMVYLVWTHQKLTGVWSFDYVDLAQVMLPQEKPLGMLSTQAMCFWAFSIAFFIKVPMFPLHTWLPDAHVQAPTGGSVILAAVMLKLGTYAYLRFSMGLFPGQAASYAPTLAGVAIMGGIIYGALCAWKQNDVKRLVAYSSVAHLGFVMLGLFGATPRGISGAILQMVNHGIATGALFMLVGVIYDRRHTREVSEFGGLAKVMPIYCVLFVIVTMASIGVPGTNGFVGEFMIIAGTFVSERLNQFSGVQMTGAAFGVILAAVYMLGVVQKMFFGPLSNPKNKKLHDISLREGLALSPLIAAIFLIGLFPRLFLVPMEAAVNDFHNQFRNGFEEAKNVVGREARMMPASVFSDTFLMGSPSHRPAVAAAAPVAAPVPAPPPGPGGAAAPSVIQLPPTPRPARPIPSAAASAAPRPEASAAGSARPRGAP
jgi:NADH-quinone oxidoreductase subunit M